MPTRRCLLGTAIAALAVSAAACAPIPAHASGRLVDLQIVDRQRGEVLPTWRARGDAWVAGQPGGRYAVRLSNRTGERVLVVLSVDGVNAVSGETAATGQTGYVLGPWQSAEITGWRKSWQEAAAFYFTALPDSYAARTDRPDNVGVIGAAVFRERTPPPPVAEAPISRAAPPPAAPGATRDAAGAFDEAPARAKAEAQARPDAATANLGEREQRLGTGHGERVWSPTRQTLFERASAQPAEVVQVRYDSERNLVAAGIVPRPQPRPQPLRQPQPFPGFAPDPRG